MTMKHCLLGNFLPSLSRGDLVRVMRIYASSFERSTFVSTARNGNPHRCPHKHGRSSCPLSSERQATSLLSL